MDVSYDQIMKAIYENNIQIIYCINRDINVNKICSNGMTLMGAAAQTGNLTVLKTLIDFHNCMRVDMRVTTDNRTTKPLYLQLGNENQKNVGYFVVCRDMEDNEFGDGPTPDGMEALEWDMEVNSADDTVEDSEMNIYRWYANILTRTSIILESPEYDIARLDRHGQSVLHYAVNSGNIEMVEYLLNMFGKELHTNFCDGCGFSPLHMAAANGDTEMVRWLLRNGASINSLGGRLRQTALHVAARGNHPNIMRILMDAGADINIVDVEERTALTSAAKIGSEEGVIMLIKGGARINHEDIEGITALQYGVWSNSTGVVKLLIQHGARVVQSHNLLQVAVSNNNFECVQALLKGGALINFRDDSGITPLMLSCSRKHVDMARFLIQSGADVNVASYIDGKTALHVCVQDVREAKSINSLIELLIEHGADMNATSYQGTVLFYSIILENQCASTALVKHGADVNLRDDRAYVDNLSLAKRHGNLDLVKMLVYGGFRISDMSIDLDKLRTQPNDPSYDFLVFIKKNPLNLREICRVSIRNSMGQKSLIKRIMALPLPTCIQKYLALEIL